MHQCYYESLCCRRQVVATSFSRGKKLVAAVSNRGNMVDINQQIELIHSICLQYDLQITYLQSALAYVHVLNRRGVL